MIILGHRLWPGPVSQGIARSAPRAGGCEYIQRPQTVLDAMAVHVRTRGSDQCLVDAEKRLTFDQVEAMADALAAVFRQRYGIQKGDRLAFLMVNGWQLALVILATFKVGALAVPLNTKLLGQELSTLLKHSGSRVLIVDPEWWPKVEPIRTVIPIEHYIGTAPIVGAGFPVLSQLFDEGRALEPVATDLREWDPALIVYTSGTTGLPKGVVITHRNIVHAIISDQRIFDLSPLDRTVVAVPMFHVTGLIAQLLLFLSCGGTTFIMRRFDAALLLEILRRERITFFHAAPTVYVLLMQVPGYDRVALPHWRVAVAGGAATSPETIRRIRAWLPHLEFCPRYGLTEATTPVTQMPPGRLAGREGSSGLPIAIMECKVVGDDGEVLSTGQAGELWVRGPNVFQEYWLNHQATRQAVDDGWLRTGDVVTIDPDGYVYVLDRIKDMINRGGEKIYSIEVENVLHDHPAILEAAIVGVPDPIYGEVPKAVVVARPGHHLTGEDVRSWIAARLAKFKVPAFVEFVSDLPKNPNGKVLKAPLRARTPLAGRG